MRQRGFGVVELILIGLATGMLTYTTIRTVESVEGRRIVTTGDKVLVEKIKITPRKFSGEEA